MALYTRSSMGSKAYNEAWSAWLEAMSGNISTAGRSAAPQQMSFQDWMAKNEGTGSSSTPAATSTASQAAQTVSAPSGQTEYLRTLQEQQQAQASQAATATAGAQASATAQGVLGQDVFSKKLASMATGTFDSSDPSYQWRFQQGQQAVERSSAAQGLLGSGNVAIALQQYGQGAASQEYAAQFARMLQGSQNATSQYTAAYNTLAQMMGQQTSVGQLGNSLAQTGVAQGQLAHSYYATNVGAQTARYATDVGAATSRYATDVGASTSNYATATGAQTSRANVGAQVGLGYAELAQKSQAAAAEQQGMQDLWSAYQSGGLFGNTGASTTSGTSGNLWGTASQPQASGSYGDGSSWGSWGGSGSISIIPTEFAY